MYSDDNVIKLEINNKVIWKIHKSMKIKQHFPK